MDCSFLFLYGSLFLFNIKQFTEKLCVDFYFEMSCEELLVD